MADSSSSSTSLFSIPPERRLPVHGGDTTWATTRFGEPAGGWLDLSTAINPEAYPVPEIPAELWHRLPTSGDLNALVTAAGEAYGAPAEAIVASGGSEAVLTLLPRLLAPTKVAVLSPGYGSHMTAWKAAGHRIQAMPADNVTAQRLGETRILVVGNPNNPDGARFAPDLLLSIADQLSQQGGLLVVDEAFADGDSASSIARHAGREGLLVFRSIGKFYGVPGARVGFALAAPRLGAALREGLGAWPVSTPACRIATAALQDSGWRETAIARVRQRGEALDRALEKADLPVFGGTLLFRLVRHSAARTLFNRLGEQGVLVRAFTERSEWLRFGIPDEAGLPRLAAALEKARGD
ncbi:MAG: threonine-phosphate decarboxylase CobD [Gemmatimonas sp.]